MLFKNTSRKILFVIIAVVIGAVVLGYCGFMAYLITGPALTQTEVEALFIEEIQPRLDEIRKEYELEDLQAELKIVNYKQEEPAILSGGKLFSKGSVTVDYNIIYKSSSFEELDKEDFGPKALIKYGEFPTIKCSYVSNPRYHIHMHKSLDDNTLYPHAFKSGSGDVYSFKEDIVYKNGEKVYGEYRIKNSTKGTFEKCPHCNGTGKVKYNYGGSDIEAIIDGHEASWYGQCGSCQGKGKILR